MQAAMRSDDFLSITANNILFTIHQSLIPIHYCNLLFTVHYCYPLITIHNSLLLFTTHYSLYPNYVENQNIQCIFKPNISVIYFSQYFKNIKFV